VAAPQEQDGAVLSYPRGTGKVALTTSQKIASICPGSEFWFHPRVVKRGSVLASSDVVSRRDCGPRFSRVSKVAFCFILLTLFSWPAIYNGQPFFSPDTSAYIRAFDAGMVWIFDRTSAWTTWAAHAHTGNWSALETTGQASLQNPHFIIAGRSITYGALLYVGELLGELWATIIVQAVIALAAVTLTLRHFNIRDWSHVFLAVLTLGLFTSLPFFVSFLLPDIFAGLALLRIANLAVFGQLMTRWERAFWFGILTLAAIFHPSHLAMILVGAATITTLWLVGETRARISVMVLIVSAGIGIASELFFNFAVEKILGIQVSRPPVVAARIIADGTGADYLRKKCPDANLTMCEFVDRLLPNSDAFLWNEASEGGIYKSAPLAKRNAMGIEQYRFAAAVFASNPSGQLGASFKNGLKQLTMTGLGDFQLSRDVVNVPEVYIRRNANSAAARGIFPFAFFSVFTSFVAIASIAILIVAMVTHKTMSRELKLFFALIVVGQLANALICGALSGPHERYQARLAWLLPLTALLLYCERREPALISRIEKGAA
jgi:hypothetical protein